MPAHDETCRAFDSAEVGAGALHRLVVGVDAAPRRLSASETAALGDPFATLLAGGTPFPRSGEDVVERLVGRVGPLRTFVLGEGSQLPAPARTAGLRFVVTLGAGPEGPDVFVSVFSPAQTSRVEVMAWDPAGGFNFYRSSAEDPGAWLFAGNSRDAFVPESRGKGVFESHRSGSLLMKELKQPWQNWHSPNAAISDHVLDGDARRTHPWFTGKELRGAYAFSDDAAKPSITRWATARFHGAAALSPRAVLEQILDTQTVNLVTSSARSSALPSVSVALPRTFFVDADALVTLGLRAPPAFAVDGDIYQRCLERFDVRLEDGRGFVQKGDTHFCFLVPERAFEDQEALRQALGIGLVSPRLAASLLMVDACNPVFSDARRSLLRHVPEQATSSFAQVMAANILAAAEAGTPEAAFAELWHVGEDFRGPFNAILRRYFDAVTARLPTQAGFEAYFELAEARRRRFAEMPINEFPLLLPRTNLRRPRRMQPDGTVGT